MKLYSKAGSCSMAVHVLLNELNQPVDLIPYKDKQGNLHKDLKAINPRGNVPVIQDGEFHMREGGAILTWLCDEYNSELLPRNGQARAESLQWLMFANATVHPAYALVFFLKGQTMDSEQKDHLLEEAQKRIQSLWDIVEEELNGQDYICGEQIQVADILLTVIANWSPLLGIEIQYGPLCKGLFKRVSERDSFQKALKDESITYRVAA